MPTAFPDCVPLADGGLYGRNVDRLIRVTNGSYYSVEESWEQAGAVAEFTS